VQYVGGLPMTWWFFFLNGCEYVGGLPMSAYECNMCMKLQNNNASMSILQVGMSTMFTKAVHYATFLQFQIKVRI
jgi:hypothetical protein